MDLSTIPFLFVLGVSLFIGFRFSRFSKKQSDYFLGNRSLNWKLIAMTFAATQIGSGFILGTSAEAMSSGPLSILFPIGYCCGFFALASGYGARLRSLELNTTSDIFEKFYKSPFLHKSSSVLSILSLFGLLISQAIALKSFLISLGCTSEWLFLVSWLIVIVYTTQGGFLAVVWTDAVQTVCMITMLVGTFLFLLYKAPFAALTSSASDVPAQWDLLQPKLLNYLLMPFLFVFIEQDMAQRCFAGRSNKDVSKGALAAACCLLLLAPVPVYVGVLAKHYGLNGSNSATFMDVVTYLSNPAVSSFAGCAILLAVISTSSSLLSAVSSNISQDFINKNETMPLWKTKMITFLVGLLAVIGSYFSSNILSCMVASYELSVSCLLVPIVFAVLYKEKSEKFFLSAFLSFFFGIGGFVLSKSGLIMFDAIPLLNSCLPLCFSFSGFAGGMFFTRREPVGDIA